MKHIIKKFNGWAAGCSRPGCMASLEGGIVENMSQEKLENFFSSDCPAVWNKGKEMNHSQSVKYLLNYANKEIKSWQKLIKYWEPPPKNSS